MCEMTVQIRVYYYPPQDLVSTLMQNICILYDNENTSGLIKHRCVIAFLVVCSHNFVDKMLKR